MAAASKTGAGRRRIAIGAVALAIAALAWVFGRPEPVPVDLAQVETGPLQVTIDAEGQTRIREIYDLSAPVSGELARSPVEVGDAVVAGETVVARIAPGAPSFLDDRSRARAEAAVAQAEAALALAQSQIAMAEADLGHAQVNLSRLIDLYDRGTAPQAQLDEAELNVDLAAAKLDAAHATYDMRKSELAAQKANLIEPGEALNGKGGGACCVNLVAPVSGTVLNVAHESARVVQAGTLLLSIGETHDLEVVADILSSDAVRLSPGAPARVERWGGDSVLAAHVSKIDPVGFTKMSALGIEEQRVKVWLDFDSQEDATKALGHGYRVFLRMVEWQSDKVLRLPVSALFRDGTDWAVYVIAEGKAMLRHIRIGHRNDMFAEVLDGLTDGDRVITHPGDRVRDGVLVEDRAGL